MKKIAFIFPGQGSQKIGMGEDFYNNFDLAKDMIKKAQEKTGIDFKKLMFEKNDDLGQTKFTQPAILLVSSIALELLKDMVKVEPKFVLGHSLGEFSALVSTGALSFEDGVFLVHKRGEFMQEDCSKIEAGMMVILGLSDEEVENICKDAQENGKKVWAANYNSDGQIVVAGLKADLKEMEEAFKNAGAKRAMLLDMSVASHCPLLQNASEKLFKELEKTLKDEFKYPVISNVTAKPYNTKDEAMRLLKEQLVKPVLYKHSIKNYENDVDLFIELGGSVLKGINRKVTKVPTISVVDKKSLEEAVEKIDS